MRSRARLIAVLSLAAILVLALSPCGVGVAVVPTVFALVSPEARAGRAIRPFVAPATRDVIPAVPSRAPPLA